MLHKKDGFFNWLVPRPNAKRVIHGDLRVTVKYHTVYLAKSFLDKYYPNVDRANIRVAFLLHGEEAHLVINPAQGVPFFKFSKPVKGNEGGSPFYSGRSLSNALIDRFEIKDKRADFILEEQNKIDGMAFFRIVRAEEEVN